jgi:hypothetical protein
MMVAVFAMLLAAFVSSWSGRGRLAAMLFVSSLALAVGLFLYEIYSPEYGFRMPWIQTELEHPRGTARNRRASAPVARIIALTLLTAYAVKLAILGGDEFLRDADVGSYAHQAVGGHHRAVRDRTPGDQLRLRRAAVWTRRVPHVRLQAVGRLTRAC